MAISGLALLAADGPVASLLRSYEARPAQLEMAAAIDDFLGSELSALLVEAGTGVGKSLAYLAPTMARRQPVVVATGTKALQEQLAKDDAPVIVQALQKMGVDRPQVAVVKGRSNYLCLLRFGQKALSPLLPQVQQEDHLQLIEDWLETTQTGDRAEVLKLPDNLRLWSEIDASADTCLGAKCPHRQECFIVRLRDRARAADVVITNHHLLMADEALRLGQRFGEIPESAELLPEHAILVVDEAHGLHSVATDVFGAGLSSAQVERLAGDIRRYASPHMGSAHSKTLQQQLLTMETHAQQTLQSLAPTGGDRVILDAKRMEQTAQQQLQQTCHALDQLQATLTSLDSAETPSNALAQRVYNLHRALQFVGDASDPNYVYFSERLGRRIKITAAPVNVAQPLAETVFRPGRKVVLTSATLCTDSGFASMRLSLGLAETESVQELKLASPFPYEQLVRYYLPKPPIIPDSRDHIERLCQEMEGLCQAAQGGCFLLFTSHRVLQLVYEQLHPRLPMQTLKQGMEPRHLLLQQFRQDGNAVLFGSHSFWEGIDVRGDALRMVAIDRLPFKSPADPLHSARSRLMQEQGKNPFMALALPQAILELKQGIGRLVRSSKDRGVIALLDGRITTKGYGKRFLGALPKAPKIHSFEDVTDFFEQTNATD